jgi:hypothetical protein
MLTASALDFQNALLSTAVLEGIHERCLNGEECPLGVCGRARGGSWAIDDTSIAALDGRTIDRQVERRHVAGYVMLQQRGKLCCRRRISDVLRVTVAGELHLCQQLAHTISDDGRWLTLKRREVLERDNQI